MKTRRHLAKLAFLLAIVTSPFAVAQDFMSEEEMLDTFSGITISAVFLANNNKRWTQVYDEIKEGETEGVIKGVAGGIPYRSNWFIRKGKWCENWGTGNACYDLVREDEKTIRAYEKSQPLKIAWEIL